MSQENYTTKSRKSKHLNYEERKIIERLLENNVAKKAIARLLCRDINTIRDEIKRGSVEQRKRNQYLSRNPEVPEYFTYTKYFAEVGQRNYEKARLNCGAKCKIVECREFVEYAEKKIKLEKYSPDAIAGEAKAKHLFEKTVSTQTLYNWIDAGLMGIKNIDLLQKVSRKPRTSKPKEHKKQLGRSIDERPIEINEKLRFGDWEGDSIVGKNGESSALTFVERQTGTAIVLKTESKTSTATVSALLNLKISNPRFFETAFKSITFDNGAEFAAAEELEALGIEVYYAHPYSAWERGMNEHFNGLIRRFIPKGKDISHLSQNDLNRFASYINSMPRRKLNYLSPNDLFLKQFCDTI